MTTKPRFRIMRQGYDRFEVDQEIDNLLNQNMTLQQQINVYRKQLLALEAQQQALKKRHQQLVSENRIRERAAEEISRAALREANSIIETAYQNADMIVREAMSASRQVLVEIARISNESHELRGELKEKLIDLEHAIEGLELPEHPGKHILSDD